MSINQITEICRNLDLSLTELSVSECLNMLEEITMNCSWSL